MQRIADLWKTSKGKLIIVVTGILLFTCMCCAVWALARTPTSSQTASDSAATATISNVQITTSTPLPTDTPSPTSTPLPTATSTPPPEPIVLTGSGDSIVDITKAEYPAMLHAKYSSGGNFIVTNYDGSNNQIDLLINTIGSYEGIIPIDFFIGEITARLEIKASGPWEIQILPVSQARHATIPGTVQGTGDDMFYLDGSNADTIKADASQGTGNFIVYSYSDSGSELVFNEIAPYTGTALLDNSTFMISVHATGNWSLEITTK